MRVDGEEPLCYLLSGLLEELGHDVETRPPHCDASWEEGESTQAAWDRTLETLMTNLFHDAGQRNEQDAGASRDPPMSKMWSSLMTSFFQNVGDHSGQTTEGSASKEPPETEMWRNLMSNLCQTSCGQGAQDAGLPPLAQIFSNLFRPNEEMCKPWEKAVDISDLDLNTIELLAHNEEGRMIVRGYSLLEGEAAGKAPGQVIREVQLPEGHVSSSIRYYLSAGKVYITGLRTKTAASGTWSGESKAETTSDAAAEKSTPPERKDIPEGQIAHSQTPEPPTIAKKETSQIPGFKSPLEGNSVRNAANVDNGDLDVPTTDAETAVSGRSAGNGSIRPTIGCDVGNVYRTCLRLDGFTQSEIQVVIRDRRLTITAERNDAGDDFLDVRKFRQTVTLPEDVIVENVTSRLLDDGVLEIYGPMMTPRVSGSADAELEVQRQ